jgi:uncharacterized membrane protein SirB2
MDYLSIKAFHQTLAALSFVGFFARGCGALTEAAWVQTRLAKTVPHLVDTMLLGSALTLAWKLQIHPLNTPWLMAKIVALLIYIALGAAALRPGSNTPLRGASWVAALLCFAYIASVALSKDPRGLFAWAG